VVEKRERGLNRGRKDRGRSEERGIRATREGGETYRRGM